MKLDESFCHRVAIARSSAGLTQAQLAEMAGVVRRQIAAYEAGTSTPRPNVLQNLAAALGTTTEWLAKGMGEGPDVSNIKRTVTLVEIPVYSHTQTLWLDPIIDGKPSVMDFIPSPVAGSEDMFAIVVNGDSMASSGPYSFPDGTIVTFEPRREATHGDFVLCGGHDVNETTFKQLVIDQSQRYLKPLNPSYPLIPFNNKDVIIGVAVHSQTMIKNPSSSLKTPQDYSLDEKILLTDEMHRSRMEFGVKQMEDLLERVIKKTLGSQEDKKPT